MSQTSKTGLNKAAVEPRHSDHKTYPLIHSERERERDGEGGDGRGGGGEGGYCYISLDTFLLCGLLTSCHGILADHISYQPQSSFPHSFSLCQLKNGFDDITVFTATLNTSLKPKSVFTII